MGKIEVIAPSRLEYLLHTWADFDRKGGEVTHGYQNKAMGFVGGGCNTIEDMEHNLEDYLGAAMAAIMKDLRKTNKEEWSAIRHQYLDEKYCGLIVFYACTLKRAKGMVEAAAKRRDLWY